MSHLLSLLNTEKCVIYELLVQNMKPSRRNVTAEGIVLGKAAIVVILIENKDAEAGDVR